MAIDPVELEITERAAPELCAKFDHYVGVRLPENVFVRPKILGGLRQRDTNVRLLCVLLGSAQPVSRTDSERLVRLEIGLMYSKVSTW